MAVRRIIITLGVCALFMGFFPVIIHAQDNPLLDEDFWKTATVDGVTEILDNGGDIKARDERGRTTLHWAAAFGEKPGVVALLLDRGADIDAREEDGWTPLHGAAQTEVNSTELVVVLLDRGADIEVRNEDGATPLHVAAAHSKAPAIVAVFLDRGADIKARDNDGETPLHWAAAVSNTPEVVALLLDRGADATVQNAAGRTPFDNAKENEHLKGNDAYWRLNEARFQ